MKMPSIPSFSPRAWHRRGLHAVVAILALACVREGKAGEPGTPPAGRPPEPSPASPPSEGSRLPAAVRPPALEPLRTGATTERTLRLMQEFHDSILEWSAVVAEHAVAVPGHPGQAYYGLPGNTEDEIRPITYAVQVNAFLGEISPPSGALAPPRRDRLRADAIAALRYLTRSHVTGGGACVNGKPWGNAWQSAMWARSAGLGGWLLWVHLDDALKQAVARMVEFEADRFLARPPRNQEFSNTGAEENAWDAMITSLAANMMPGHPRAGAWDQRAKLYLYNSLSRQVDHVSAARGDDGKLVRDWVHSVNAHADYTVENHGLVHVGYLTLTIGEMFDNAIHYLLGGRPVPEACLHNIEGAYQVLLRCMSWDGAPISFGGNDWKIVHTQSTDLVVHTFLSLMKGDPVAAHLEQVALATLRYLQREEGGYYNVRRDLEYGGFCAARLTACYFAHALSGRTTAPANARDFHRRASGVSFLENGSTLLHRTPTKFASFSWGPNRMALALPENGTWVAWPHYASYLGLINGGHPNRAEAALETLRHRLERDAFVVAGRLRRANRGVVQDFAFASPARDITVYIERIRTEAGGALESRETGIVGHGYGMGENDRWLHGRHGRTRVIGIGGGEEVIALATDWLNVGDRVGHVVRRPDGRANVMRYHGMDRGSGRVPVLQEFLSLVGDASSVAWPGEDWACVVTFLNQPATETAAWAERVRFVVDGDAATCRIGDDVVRADFANMETTITEIPTLTPRPR